MFSIFPRPDSVFKGVSKRLMYKLPFELLIQYNQVFSTDSYFYSFVPFYRNKTNLVKYVCVVVFFFFANNQNFPIPFILESKLDVGTETKEQKDRLIY